jgi:hypothetical protein
MARQVPPDIGKALGSRALVMVTRPQTLGYS